MAKEMMDTREVAEYLNINEKLVYKLLKEKKIPGTRVTGKWTFPRRLIDEWVIESAKENIGLKNKPKELKDHIVIMGSNDFIVELLSHELSKKFLEYSLSFSNVGSLAGLIALGRGNSHIAGCHLLDPDTGRYNIPYISRYLPGMRATVINLAYRDIGLMVKQDNPLNIFSMKDLSRPGIKIINRQEGSGTRMLFDYECKKAGIEPKLIDGYEKDVNTHFEVAMAVASGMADAGLGILSAAKVLNLTFIHLTNEQYDFVIPRENLSAQPVVSLLAVIRSPDLKESINQMGGYDTRDTGKVMAEF
jgi:putative molybdopterin biosynthesis protein